MPDTTATAAISFPAQVPPRAPTGPPARWPSSPSRTANRTCEMGLRQATGYPYESFVFLLEELTRPA